MIVSTTHIDLGSDLLTQARHLMAELERVRRERGTQAALQAQAERQVDELREVIAAQSAAALAMLPEFHLQVPR